tara:strand:- start:1860 stop:2120 length:261 start_codon:yes stop_codon:yes gene_type:complete
MKQYTLIQKGYCILGLGATADEALKDSLEWTDETDADMIEYTQHYDSATDGSLVLIQCTDSLAKQILSQGGDTLFEVYDNTAYISK